LNMSQPAWRQILENQLTENPKYTTYALSTLSPEGQPKVRFVVHRSISPSGLLILTTDTRMQKPVHLALNHTVEAAWWIEPSNVQFRITGQAYTFPLPSSSPTEVSSALQGLGLKDIEESQGEEKEECTSEWWEKERIRLWEESMSGHLRASFARPKPGKSLEQVEHPSEWPVSLPGKSVSILYS
ncbi:hypothetical protein TREMEDRAFT_27724, partial [Tremella mesenterica DSM 1558]|uniref:uncharacterized protein n=1 Tax=Tremella mesenterica (strain ATCC 24925 / CBS 8224 / DSM 1558 / NBRC 9311 / NRRL Y-6157 / RJB 2259-6 / UBC 559-6) TaxID=578456 RepID=UPI0003F49B9E